MSDFPIIFSAPMVRALIDGRKTMTRRLAWRTGAIASVSEGIECAAPWQRVKPGDRLWVRESVIVHSGVPRALQGYRADGYQATEEWEHRVSSIHMPRWASRLTLTVTATKIERLQEISREDEIAEGVPDGMFFDALWSSIYGDQSWKSNPEVIALSFTVARVNIDHETAEQQDGER